METGEISLDSKHLKNISIPSTGFVETYVVYNIEVTLYNYSWTVNRRYREFCELHEQLTKQFPTLEKTAFPPKKLFGNFDPGHVEKRRLCFEAYLKKILTQLGKIPRPLQIFLEFHVYDVLAVTQTLAEELFKIGDSLLANEETFEVTPLQLYCISKRLKLPIPTCGGEGYCYDVGNLYDIVYCIHNLKIVEDDKHSLKNIPDEEILFDLSLFKNIKTLQISKCNVDSLQGTFHLQENLHKLSAHDSLHLLKDILIDQELWTRDTSEDILKQQDSAIMTWKHLTEIDFSHNDIPYIDESVTLLHELVILDLSHNQIQEIAHLQDLPNLRELNLSFNELKNLDSVNTKLGNITSLRLAGNRFISTGDLSKMFSLVNLDLSENDICDITDVMSLAELPCLENLILRANTVKHKPMYRMQLLTAFKDRVTQICLDELMPTDTEIKNVRRILAEEDNYEIVDVPQSTTGSPRKNKGKKKPGRRMKIKTQEFLDEEQTKAATLPVRKMTSAEDEQEFRNKVEKMRRLGGDAWLGLFNEIQNERKEVSASLPAVQKSMTDMDINEHQKKPSKEQSQLQFGFSTELENLVNQLMQENKDVVTGTFFVGIERDGSEEERMVGVDLTKGILIEIVVETGETCRKYNLDEITSVDILESQDCFYVDLLHTKHKELRRHAVFYASSGNSTENFRHVAKYRMRSMKDTAELYVLLYKFVTDALSERPRRSSSVHSQASQHAVTNDINSMFRNPIGLSPDLFQQFLSSKFDCPIETDLTESARHAAETGMECAHLILWVSCLPYALPEHELPVCLVLTNRKVYLFNFMDFVSAPKTVEQFEGVLQLMSSFPLSDLCTIIRGIFDLTFRLEFLKRGPHGTFTFLTRDPEMTESFVNAVGETCSIGNYDIISTSEPALEKLKQQIAMSCGKAFKDDECILIYSIVRELAEVTSTAVDTSSFSSHVRSTTRSLVLTNWNLFLCEEDHIHWPLPSYVPHASSTPQWVVSKHDEVKHTIGIEIFDVTDESAFVGTSGMSVFLEHSEHAQDEHVSSGTERPGTQVWNLIFKLKEEREQFQRSLSQIWSYNFNGELLATKSKPIHAKNICHTPRVDVTHFFQEELVPTGPDDPPKRTGKGHRRNVSGQFHQVLSEDSDRKSMQVLRNASAEQLDEFFNGTLREKSGKDRSETLVSYAWTGCVSYTHPTREVHVWLILSSSKFYIVTDFEDRIIISGGQEVSFGTGTKLCCHWLPLAMLRQVCVGFFDQTFRLETDEPENTYTFITRDYQVTSCFLENLKSTLKEIETERPVPSTSSECSPSIYDNYEVDIERQSEEKIHHSKGVVEFLYPNDDAVEILKHSILEHANEAKYFKSLNEINILLYLLMFQVIEGKKLSRTFMILDEVLCTCVENHVNFPLPLFVKGLPTGSRYQIQRLRLITDIKRIEFSGFNSQDFTIVYKQERLPSKVEEIEVAEEVDVVENSACCDEEERWTMIAQTYEEKEKALGMILKFWKENVGEDLPVLRI